MKRSPANRADLHASAQVAAAWARLDATSRAAELTGVLREQDRVFLGAIRELQAVRDFVGSPENILGRAATKHGEIAERVHVGVSRAWDVLHGRAPTATFDGVPRTGPVDYRVDGVDIQSKYYNGLRKTLDGVASHAEKYPGFPGGHGRYHIPGDQHRQLEELRRSGEIEGLADRSASVLQRRVDGLEQATGRPADDLIEPGDASYAEVQRGRVHDTLRDREDRLTHENEELKRTARVEHGPSTAGFVKAASFGAAVGGGVGLAQAIWITHIVAMDAAAVGLASVAGQTMIPVPLLGALLGGLAGKLVASALQDGLGESEWALISRLSQYERYALEQLDEEFRAVMQGLDAWFGNLERLAVTAFDPAANADLLMASVRVAEIVGVPDARIVRKIADLDALMQE